MSLTFDTNVLLSATLWDGSVSQKLLFDLIRLDESIFSSPQILDEFKSVLKRDFLFSQDEINEIVNQVLQFVTLVYPSIRLDIVTEDSKDNMVVECAVASKSRFIISYDKHLLALKECNGIRIIKPEEARSIY
jgi:putative PIN family toxin of toxin-antitoxin system